MIILVTNNFLFYKLIRIVINTFLSLKFIVNKTSTKIWYFLLYCLIYVRKRRWTLL